MFRDKKVIVVMPAYNAAKTLQQTHAEVMAQDYFPMRSREMYSCAVKPSYAWSS
jgi:hypothetical protein